MVQSHELMRTKRDQTDLCVTYVCFRATCGSCRAAYLQNAWRGL